MATRGVGEFELIARLASRLKSPGEPGVVGIGDDTAAIPMDGGFLLLTCDISVEGRHFERGLTPMEDLGWKVATSCVSDVVACGGLPTYALVSLAVPEGGKPEEFDALYEGLNEAALHYGFQVVGGNVTGAGQTMVDCFMLGKAPRFIPRRGVAPGHLIAVSGTLGDSDAGRSLLGRKAADGAEALLQRRHLHPVARTDAVGFLQQAAQAAIDISDSLASELHHLARASGVKLEVAREKIPVSPELVAFSAARGEEPWERALFGGEDYQILCAVPPREAAAAADAGFTVIGQAEEGAGVLCSGRPLPDRGWDHLLPRKD